MPYSVGANKSEQLAIRDLTSDGYAPEQISHLLKIEQGVVEKFLPQAPKASKEVKKADPVEPAPAKKPAAKKAKSED